MKTPTSTTAQRRTSAKRSTGEAVPKLPKPRPKKEKPAKKPVELLRYDFMDSYRGSMTTLVNNATQNTKRRWITLTEWPMSLIEAYDAGVLTGEAELTARAIKAMVRGRE